VLTIAFEFLARRYHASAWDHHVNEGTVEWPPSPWRIARALLAASYKLWPTADESEVKLVLELLLEPPSYQVPAAGEGHSRHYMPTDQPGKPVKVFDAFVAPAGQLLVHWPDVEFDAAQNALIDRILDALVYLGRAESWVEARRVEQPPSTLNCTPAALGGSNIALHVPVRPSEYLAWCDGFLAAQLDLPKKDRRELPATWWEVLHISTERLFRDGWSSPPGVRRAQYMWNPMTSPRPRRSTALPRRLPTMARFACSSVVLPRLTEALSVGERLRVALMSHSDGHPVFSGRLPGGEMRRGHDHAYFAPSDDDADGKIDHVLVHAREGFDERAIFALQHLRKVWGLGGHDLVLTLIALGQVGDFGGLRRDADRLGASALLGPASGAHIWESHTPFVPPRHTKRRRGILIDRPEDQLRVLLAQLEIATNVVVEPISARHLSKPQPPKPIEWYRFRARRQNGGGTRGSVHGFGFRLTFAELVRGPIALGYGAHQGLGHFVAVE
jgi:CRISPR-associated protein Csb2